MISTALDAASRGIMVIERDGSIGFSNAMARGMLGTGGTISGIAGLEVTDADGDTVQAAEGAIRIHATRMTHGAVLLLEERESAGDATEYRSLFENSVYGVYRDTLDGRPLRGNPALAQFNGYETEEEYLAGVSASPGNWYVDPGRIAEFRRILDRDGRVRDLVSEVYRHRTRERVWITENAWYVRDAEGNPVCIEGTIQEATERVQSLAAIERQANTDSLTGAASRFCFLNRLRREATPDRPGCVLFTIDLDRFKEVNDLLGHGAGDLVLKTVAERLRTIAGPMGLVARLGGDEFAILQSGGHCHIRADGTALAIVKALRQPIMIEGRGVVVGGSVGAAVYPAHAANAAELLTHADLALYQVKASGRNGFRLFDHELRASRERRSALEAELRAAVAANELELYYQPIVDAKTCATRGFEALMRWNHPRLGFMPPSTFIAIAEEAGLMTELGNWAIERACEQAAALPAGIFVSVNVSPTQFRSAKILSAVRHALAATGLDPSRLTLELTESVILPSETNAASIISELQSLGVQLALDDFGTGYSSLSYLQRFRFSKVKIDRSFVAGMDKDKANLAIIRATIDLCRDLEIDVVAEGIESPEQAGIIGQLGCRYQQGYLFGKPKRYSDAMADLALSRFSVSGSMASSDPDLSSGKRTVHNPL